MAVIEFRTLGALDLRRTDGSELHSLLAQPKRVALLTYLCVASPRGFHRRDTLLGLFWPDADQAHARTSLRNALHVLRHSLGEAAFHSRGDEEVAVNFETVWCDAVAFDEQAASEAVDGALDLYRGDLLTGFFLDDVPAFERWLESERARFRELAASAARIASERSESEGNLPDALNYARRAIGLANADERAVRRLIELLTRVGDRAAALQAYEKFAEDLRSEFEAEPSSETRALVERLRSKKPQRSVDTSQKDLLEALTQADDSTPPPVDIPRIGGRRTKVAPRRIATSLLVGLLLLIAALSIARRISTGNTTVAEVRQKLTATGNAMMGSVSPDGQFLAYVAQVGDSQRVLVQDIAGGTPLTVKTQAGAVWSLEWAPDSRSLALGGFQGAIVVPRLGGQSVKVGPDVGGQPMAYWLPDRKWLSVHQSSERRILVFNPQTQDTLALPVRGNYLWLMEGSWSPTGRVFAMMTETGDPLTWQLRAVTLDGKNALIVTDSVNLGSPRWSRDGTELYYARGSDGIWRVPVSAITGEPSGAPEKVIGDLEIYVQRFGLVHFALTPDGNGITYAKGARFSNLWLVERNGEVAHPRTQAITTGTSLRWSPVASPDGKLIAFAQDVDGVGEIFTVPMTGGSPTQITTGARVHPENQIAWSPDGTQIAFGTVRAGHAQVWVVKIAHGTIRGFAQTRMSTTTGALAWAPGSAIAYQNIDNGSINLIDPTSGKIRILAQSPADGWAHSPSYSPDGKSVAVFYGPGEKNGRPGIYIFDVRSSSVRGLVGGLYPRGWSGDSRFIYYQWPQSPIIYRLDTRGRTKGEVFLKPPFRMAQCKPVGAARPNAFICAVFDFASDIWRIDNFDQHEQ